MNPNFFQTPIDYLKGVGPNRADLLRKELGIHTYQDLMNLFPNRYLDRTKYYKINELQRNSSEVQIIGKIIGFKEIAQKRTTNAIKSIALIGNLSNKRDYEYTEEEVTQILNALTQAINDVKKRFEPSNKGNGFNFQLE